MSILANWAESFSHIDLRMKVNVKICKPSYLINKELCGLDFRSALVDSRISVFKGNFSKVDFLELRLGVRLIYFI